MNQAYGDRNFLGRKPRKSEVCPSRVSPGAARCLKTSGFAVDILLDARQRCAAAGNSEVGRDQRCLCLRTLTQCPLYSRCTAWVVGPLSRGTSVAIARVGGLNSTSPLDSTAIVFSQKVSMSFVKTGRRYLVTNTRLVCSADALWRARR